jgi:hypothetical protein
MACPSSRQQAKDVRALAEARDDLARLWQRITSLPRPWLAWFRARRQRAIAHQRGAGPRQ